MCVSAVVREFIFCLWLKHMWSHQTLSKLSISEKIADHSSGTIAEEFYYLYKVTDVY